MKYIRADALSPGDRIQSENGLVRVVKVSYAKVPVFVLGGTFGQKSIRVEMRDRTCCYVNPSLEIEVCE